MTSPEKPIFSPFDSSPRLVLAVIAALFLVGLVTHDDVKERKERGK
jgi:hypothetical protein